MHEQSRARIQNESLAGIRQLLHGNQVQSFFIRGRNQKALDYELAAILKLPRRVRNLRPRELRPVIHVVNDAEIDLRIRRFEALEAPGAQRGGG